MCYASKIDFLSSFLRGRVRLSQRCLGIILFVFGLIIFLSPFIYKKYIGFKSEEIRKKETKLTSQEVFPSEEVIKTGPVKIDKNYLTKNFSLADLPTRIIIPSPQIDLPVKPARIVEGSWELSSDSASFGLGSATPGNPGNSVIFAHAKWGLFRPLRQIKKGARVYILAAVKWYLYEVTEIKTVLPSQIEVIEPTEDETLTLFTCTGFTDAKRLIVVAKRISD